MYGTPRKGIKTNRTRVVKYAKYRLGSVVCSVVNKRLVKTRISAF